MPDINDRALEPVAAADLAPLPPAAAPSPAALYLATLPSKMSRDTQAASLELLARLMRPGARAADVDWSALNLGHVAAIVGQLSGKYAVASVSKHLCALRGVLKASWRVGLIDGEQLARLLDQAKGPRQHEEPLSGRCLEQAEIDKLFQSCKGYDDALRDGAILALAYGAGLRRSEISSAERAGYVRGVVNVMGKGRKRRAVPLPPTAQLVLEAWLAVKQFGEPVPLTARIVQLAPASIYDVLERVAARAGVADFSPHDLRRSFVTHLLEAGVDPITVARLAGHDSTKTTMKYDRRADSVKAEATARLKVPFEEASREE